MQSQVESSKALVDGCRVKSNEVEPS